MRGGTPIKSMKNLMLKSDLENNEKPQIRPLIKDLDTMPMPDYDMTDHFIYHDGDVVPFTNDIMHYHFLYRNPIPALKGTPIYTTVTARGCPHHCAYCCNSTYLKLYKGDRILRH